MNQTSYRKIVGSMMITMVSGGVACALELHDEFVSFQPVLYLQVRAEAARSTYADGGSYNVTRAVDGYADDARVYLRRLLMGGLWHFDHDWTATVLWSADQYARKATNNPITIDRAVIGHVFTTGSISHLIQFGKVQTDFCSPARTVSMLMPTVRPTVAYNEPPGGGVSTRSSWNNVVFSANIYSQTGDDDASTTDKRGLFYGARLEVTGPPGFSNSHWVESFLGEPGLGLTTAIEAGYADHEHTDVDVLTAGAQPGLVNRAIFGAEMLFHWDALTALGEIRTQHRWGNSDDGRTATDTVGMITSFQAGWALPLSAHRLLEPALRYSHIDHDLNNHHEGLNYGPGPDNGVSGEQFDAAITYHLHDNLNKIGLAIQRWYGEAGPSGTHPQATIIRLQQQLYFLSDHQPHF